MIENKIDKYLDEKLNLVDTKEFASYKKEFLASIKRAGRQLEKDMTLFVQKYNLGYGGDNTPDEIKQQVKDAIQEYFETDDIPVHVYYNISNLIDV